MIVRTRHVAEVRELLGAFPVVAVLGARQVGKTTLSRDIAAAWPGPVTTFDLEDPVDQARLTDGARTLRGVKGLVVIDEIQRAPALFPLLRVLADRADQPARFLILGSAAPDVRQQGSESLAGRLAAYRLDGLGLDEVGAGAWRPLWNRGGSPRSFLAATDAASARWRREFVATFLERDAPQLGITVPAPTLRRFWTMLAHWHGQVWNAAAFGEAFGVSGHAVRRYIEALVSTFVVRQLQPWHENVGKRQVKSPKIYISDSGLLHTLLGLGNPEAVFSHPVVGASWEGFALQSVVAHLRARPEECFFWRTHGGAEMDLLVVRGTQRRGFEFNLSEAPAPTASMRMRSTICALSASTSCMPAHARGRWETGCAPCRSSGCWTTWSRSGNSQRSRGRLLFTAPERAHPLAGRRKGGAAPGAAGAAGSRACNKARVPGAGRRPSLQVQLGVRHAGIPGGTELVEAPRPGQVGLGPGPARLQPTRGAGGGCPHRARGGGCAACACARGRGPRPGRGPRGHDRRGARRRGDADDRG